MRAPSSKAAALFLAACLSSRSALASYHLDETYVGTSTPTVFPMGPTSPAPESAAPAAAGAPDDSSATQLTCPDTLDQSAIIDSSATLYYAVVPSDPAGSGNGLLCGRLEVEDQDGWIGMGFSADGLMTGSQAIIGIPADGTVLKYDLTYTAAPMSDDRQTLTGTSIAEADGRVMMEFAKLLVEEGEVAILEGVENRFIHARGPSELGYHTNGRTSASVVLATTAGDQDSAGLPPAPTPDASAVIDTTEGAKDCTKEMCEYQLADNFLLKYQVNVPSDTTLEVCEKCTISMEAIYDGEAWVAIAFSTDGSMIGSESVIGIPGGVPQKYDLLSKSDGVVPMPDSAQTLTDASVEVVDGQTIMKFTKIMKETNEIEIKPDANTFLWAYGSSNTLGFHSARSPFDLNLSSGLATEVVVPNYSAWLAHGIMAFLAWGVLVPFAVNSSLFRGLLPNGPLWLNLHRAFNTTAFALFVVIFSIAVSYTTKEGAVHFDDSHQRMGLSMFILTILQVLGGVFRPHLPVPDSGEEKSKVRKGWEGKHRLFGTALLACGFWQMSSGIKFFSTKYSVSASSESKVCIAYWVWIGVMTATIVLGVWHSKIRKRTPSAPSGNVPPSVDYTDSGVVMPKVLEVEVDADGEGQKNDA